MSSWWKKPAEAKYHGLINHGATCYLNSVLQVLFMTKEFRETINRLTSPSKEHIDHHLKQLFADLLQRTANPDSILRALKVNNVYEQQDAAEYFERILRETSEDAAQIFHGQLTHRTTCSKCKTLTDSEGPFWHLPLELEDSPLGNYNVENGINMFFTTTTFDGDNQMYCEICDDKVDADRKYVITRHPDVLLLMLKRFDFSYHYMSYIKIHCIANVPHTIRIPENQTYELYAVVEHFGDLRAGHYRTVIKCKDEGDKWFTFDDSLVTQLATNPFHDNVGVEPSSTAYLLFYRRKDVGSEEMMRSSNPDPKCVHAQSNVHAGPNNSQEFPDNTAQALHISSSNDSGHTKIHLKAKQEDDEGKARDHLMVEQTMSKENQPNTRGCRLGQSKNSAVDVPNIPDDMTDLQISAEGKSDENKGIYERENSHAQDKTTMDGNSTEQVKPVLPAYDQIQVNDHKKPKANAVEDTQADFNYDSKPKNNYQSELRDENKQKGETEECLNDGSAQHHVGKESGYFPQSKHKYKENNQKIGEEKGSHTFNENHKKSDERSKNTTFKEEVEGQAGAAEASRYLDSRGADESKESKPKNDHIIETHRSYKDQKEHNKNTRDKKDKNNGVSQSKLDEKQKSMKELSITNALDLKKGNTEPEAKGEQKDYGLKTHTKGQGNEEYIEDFHKPTGSEKKESLKGKQAADGEKKANQGMSQANTQKGVKSSADRDDRLLEYKVIEEASGSSFGNEVMTTTISQGSIKRKEGNNIEQHITEEQRHLTSDEQKHTTRASKRQHKNPRETKHSKHSSLKEIPNTWLDGARTDDSFKRRSRPKIKWPQFQRIMNQHTQKKKKKKRSAKFCLPIFNNKCANYESESE